MYNMDTDLLLRLFSIPAISMKEECIREFIISYLEYIGVDYQVDKVGNVFNLCGKDEPLLSAHMDTVQNVKDVSLLDYIKIEDGKIIGKGIIGGDDKCGIYIIMQILKTHDINFLFTVGEESGGVGIKHFIKQHDLLDVLYGLILDRRGNSDIICYNNRYGTKEFEVALLQIASKYSYKSSRGIFSDGNYLRRKLSCANLSVGYHSPHTSREYVNLVDLQTVLDLTKDVINSMNDRFDPAQTYSRDTTYKITTQQA